MHQCPTKSSNFLQLSVPSQKRPPFSQLKMMAALKFIFIQLIFLFISSNISKQLPDILLPLLDNNALFFNLPAHNEYTSSKMIFNYLESLYR